VQRAIRRGLVALAALTAVLVPLSGAYGGVFSGGNGLIAYTCGTTICRINPDGTSKLSTFPASATDPSWSGDGTEVAYVDSTGAISVANADGTSPRSLGTGVGSTEPSFSEDGTRVAYVKQNDIFWIRADTGGGDTNLTNSTATDADPAVSPDGSQLAFASNSGSGYDIWTLDIFNPAVLVHVTIATGDERHPTWSPSGSTIVYSSANQLFTVSAFGGGTPQPLNVAGTDPTYSPDGTKIAYSQSPSGNLVSIPATVSASPAVTTIDGTTGNAQPDWQSIAPPPDTTFTGPPRNVAYPTITLASGDSTPIVGHLVTASVGTWNGSFPITYKYQWKRCDAGDPLNGACVDITTATSSFYTPTAADAGKRLRLAVTATNSEGTGTQNSESSAVVVALAVRLRVTPQIVGQNMVDQTLSLTAGTWDGSTPIAFTYSWRRCNPVGDLESCVQIPGATTLTYTPKVEDIGFSIRVWITGANIVGSDVAITNHTFPIVDKPHFAPSATRLPAVAGTSLPGRQLTANIGSYGGDAPIATSFVWQRCDATGAACRLISGAKRIVYFPTLADIGYTLRLSVTATNTYGTMIVQSPPTDTVAASPPHKEGRHIVGTDNGEYIGGGGNDDWIEGRGGNDTLVGGAGDDRIEGGPGNDVITGGHGADKLFGGTGSDTINAADDERDVVDCGDGRDRVVADSFDKASNCEVVDTSSAETTTPETPTTPTTPGTTTTGTTTTTPRP
jgi:hypothetical protein